MKCKACKQEIDDNSVFCKYCGKKQIITPKKAKGRGNGQGTVYQLPNGKWRATVTLAYGSDGKRKTKSKQFDKKVDALKALPEMLATPEQELEKLTFKQVYDAMLMSHESSITSTTLKLYNTMVKRFEPIYNVKMADLKLKQLQDIFDSSTYGARVNMRTVCSLTFDYAMKHDIINKDYSKFVEIGKSELKEREAFTVDEVKTVLEHAEKGTPYADYIACLIFTGFRPGELFDLKKSDYYDGCLHGGSKTKAGKNRVVPVSPIIQPFIEKRMQFPSEYIFSNGKGTQMKVIPFAQRHFPNALQKMGIEHKLVPHSCRHTFATLCNKTNSNDFAARKKLIGHTDLQTTARYTHSDIEDMKAIIEQISV